MKNSSWNFSVAARSVVVALLSILAFGVSLGAAEAAPHPAAVGASHAAANQQVGDPVSTMDFASCKDEPVLAQPAGADAKTAGYLYARCKNFDDCDDYGTYLYLWIGIIADYECSQFGDEWWLWVY